MVSLATEPNVVMLGVLYCTFGATFCCPGSIRFILLSAPAWIEFTYGARAGPLCQEKKRRALRQLIDNKALIMLLPVTLV